MNNALVSNSLGILLDISLKMSLILGVAFAVTALLRRSAASVRQVAWNMAFCGVLSLPLLALFLPEWQSSWLPSVFLNQGQATGTSVTGACIAMMDSSLMGFLGFLSQQLHTPFGITSSGKLLLQIWLLGASALILKALAENFLLNLGFARAQQVTQGRTWLILREASYTLGLRRLPMLAVGSFGVPATFGLIRPKVVLPEEAELWSDERLRVVLLHEVAHIKNADYLFNIAAQGVCALLWHNPLAWLAARQMRLERECAADDAVLATGQQQVDYAQHLFEIAQATRGNSLGASAAVAMAHHCSLKTRVTQILDPNKRRERLSRRHLFTGSLVFVLLIAPLAAMQPAGQMSAECLKACMERIAACNKTLPLAQIGTSVTEKENCQKLSETSLKGKDQCQSEKEPVTRKPCTEK